MVWTISSEGVLKCGNSCPDQKLGTYDANNGDTKSGVPVASGGLV